MSSTEPSTAQTVEQSSTVSTPSTADQSLTVALSSTTNEQDSLKRIENHCGREVWKSITNGFKARAIAAVASGEKPIDAAKKFNANRSQISKWLKNKDVINKAAVKENKQLFKVRPTVKYNALHDELEKLFLDARNKGHCIDFNWLWSKARMIHHKQQQDPSEDIKKHVVSFIKRKHLKLRRVQRNKKTAKEEFRAAIAKWHSTPRERLVKTGRSRSNYHPVYGSFMPEQRLNVDQSPLPFVIDTKTTYEHVEPRSKENRHKKVWVSQPGSRLEKRQCTLQICFRPEGEQPKIGIIFRGMGKS